MARCFNADDDDRPFLYSRLWPDGWFGFSPWHGAVQIGGRHLEAMLRAAAVTGTPPDDDAIEKHTRASFFSFGGPIPLPCNRRELGGQLVEIDEHGIREGFLALNALVRDRNNDQAAELAESFIAAIQEFWSPERGWDVASLKRRSGLPFYARPTFVEGLGRAIGPLVKYVRTTGSDAALELAQTLEGPHVGQVLPCRRLLRDGTLRGARALDDVRDVVAGAARRSDRRRRVARTRADVL